MSKPVKRVATEWKEVVLVCRKCSKKLGGGFGTRSGDRFAKALRRAMPGGSGKKAKGRGGSLGIVEVDCLDLCPKGAVVTMRAGAPGAWLVIPAGTAMDKVVRDLGLLAEASDASGAANETE